MLSEANKTKIRDEVENIAVAVTVVAAIVSVLGRLTFIDELLDLATHFALFYALAVVPPLLLFRARRPFVSLLAVAVIGVNGFWFAPWAPTTFESSCEAEVTALAINAFGMNSDHDALIEQVVDIDADIVFVSELRPVLRKRFEKLYAHTVWYETGPGIALFSKYPVVDAEVLFAEKRPYLNVTLDTGEGAVRVIGVHAEVPVATKNVVLRNDNFAVVAAIAASSAEPVIALGDFNATMYSPYFDVFREAGLLNVREGRGNLGTWPMFSPLRIPIDHLMQRGLRTCDVQVGANFGSDHLPLTATFAR